MKLYIVGEGPHDVGYRNIWCSRAKDHVNLDGWLQPMVRNILATKTLDIESQSRDRLVIDQRLRNRLRPLPSGHGMKALLAKRSALVAGYDAVVYMVDADSTDLRRWREIVDEIKAGFDALPGEIASVACVPMSASESWLLCDLQAWSQITNIAVQLPRSPEAIWGERNDPEGNHPHRLFKRMCELAEVEDGRDIRSVISGHIELATIRANCPQSFVPFEQALLAA